MQNIVLTIHLILALCLIGAVLLQRSEGGGLGSVGGGGGAGGGVMSGRSAATALSKLTWFLATGFLITSISLTVLASRDAAGDSVVERNAIENTDGEIALPPSLEGDLTAPVPSDQPALPPVAD